MIFVLTVRKMVHRVKTASGVSEGSITWDATSNPGGIGQGSGGGPQAYHSHILVKAQAYENLTNQCIKFNNPDGTEGFSQWLIGFVDDNSILISVQNLDFTKTMVDELLNECKQCIVIWQNLVVIAGGKLK